jgi:hypothetical protein
MKKQIRQTAFPVLFLIAVGIVPAGYAADVSHLNGMLPVESGEMDNIVTYRLQAKHIKEGLYVTGRAKRRHHSHLSIRGHMEIEVVDAAGVVLARKKAYLSRHNQMAKHRRDISFSTLFANIPAGTHKVRILSHAGTGPH